MSNQLFNNFYEMRTLPSKTEIDMPHMAITVDESSFIECHKLEPGKNTYDSLRKTIIKAINEKEKSIIGYCLNYIRYHAQDILDSANVAKYEPEYVRIMTDALFMIIKEDTDNSELIEQTLVIRYNTELNEFEGVNLGKSNIIFEWNLTRPFDEQSYQAWLAENKETV